MVGNVVKCLGRGIIDSSGGIVKFNGQSSGGGIDEYFDPVTHTATEENFIRFLEAGIYTTDVIGYKVALSNNVIYNNGTYTIIDLNHDSANTGQTNCYDLMSTDIIGKGFYWSTSSAGYNNSPYTAIFRDTYIRTWLNNNFYPGFSTNIKPHIMSIKYNSCGYWYNDDKIILPSYREMNFWWGWNSSSYYFEEGIPYSIFTDDNSRIKKLNGSNNFYWARSYNKLSTSDGYNMPVAITNSGSYSSYVVNVNTIYIAPLFRVQ